MPFIRAHRSPREGLSFLGPRTELRGTLRFCGQLILNGVFRGKIEGEGCLELGEAARTEGRIDAADLVHRGESAGDIRASRHLMLEAGAFHRGDIEARRIKISPSARLEGHLKMPEIRPDPPKADPRPRRRKGVVLASGVLAAAAFWYSDLPRTFPDRLWRWSARLREIPRSSLSGWLEATLRGLSSPDEAQGRAALLEEADRLEKQGQTERAAALLARAAEGGHPQKATVRFRLAKMLVRMGKTEGAIHQLGRLVREFPGHIEGRLLLGDLYARAGRYAEAGRAYRAAIRRDPEDVVLRRRLSRLQGHLKKKERPRKSAPPAVQAPPPGRVLAQAERRLAEGEAGQAVRLLRQSAGRLKASARFHYLLAVSLEKAGGPEEAIREYRQAIRLAPDWLDAYIRLGDLLESRRRDAEAIALYEKAARLDRSNVEMRVRVAQLHNRRGRREVAHRLLKKLYKEQPKSVAVLVALGTLHWESGNPEKAKDLFRQVLEVDPYSAEALNRLAWFHAVEGKNLERGIELSKRSLEIRPGTAPFLDTLAELYYRNGQPVEAISRIQRAIEIDPKNRYYRVQLEKFKRASR